MLRENINNSKLVPESVVISEVSDTSDAAAFTDYEKAIIEASKHRVNKFYTNAHDLILDCLKD